MFGFPPIVIILFYLLGTVFWFAILVGASYVGTKLANRPPGNYVSCSFCAERISPAARICRYCRSETNREYEIKS
jgi:hypothetical protein